MTVTFSEHVDLLDLHGRAAAASLVVLTPGTPVPPRGSSRRALANDHWATLEVWAWSLENPNGHWSSRTEPGTPAGHDELVAGLASNLDRLETALLGSGPDAVIDYFGAPGTTAQVARLLAHEAITVAHAVSLAAERQSPALSNEVAVDGIDQALGHWASPEADEKWSPETLALRASDSGDAWHLQVSRPRAGVDPEIRLVPAATAEATVEGAAVDLLWWIHGHPMADDVVMTGHPETILALRSSLMHPVPETPRRRRRWFG